RGRGPVVRYVSSFNGKGAAASPLGAHRRALRLPQLDGARLFSGRFGVPARRAERHGEPETRLGVVEERVGRGGDVDGGPAEVDGGGRLATPRPCLRPNPAPRDGRLRALAGERPPLVAPG